MNENHYEVPLNPLEELYFFFLSNDNSSPNSEKNVEFWYYHPTASVT